ncbi:hypothetical protein ACHAW6_012029 [Cyclotella cf. meneghiniana]
MKIRTRAALDTTTCHTRLHAISILCITLRLSTPSSSFPHHRHQIRPLSISRSRTVKKTCLSESKNTIHRAKNHKWQHCFSMKSNKVEDLSPKSQNNRWIQTPFDFSSKPGWDNFYRTGRELSQQDTADIVEDSACPSLEYEWHSHIPHSAIIDAIAPSIHSALHHSSLPTSRDRRMPSILIIGCGNSSLPRILHDAFSHPVRITCLDYSAVCIDMIRQMYGSSCPNMDFVVGDATKLKDVLKEHNSEDKTNSNMESDSKKEYRYDVVIDKGLMDALMCGEGFEVEALQRGIDQVLTTHDWGIHVLICFPLSTRTKESLVDLGKSHDREERNENGSRLFWRFNVQVAGSDKGRASFNVGKRSKEE